jgi:hypothetical protein
MTDRDGPELSPRRPDVVLAEPLGDPLIRLARLQVALEDIRDLYLHPDHEKYTPVMRYVAMGERAISALGPRVEPAPRPESEIAPRVGRWHHDHCLYTDRGHAGPCKVPPDMAPSAAPARGKRKTS